MEQLPGIFFEMNAPNMNSFDLSVDFDVEPAADADRYVVLADLVTLRQIGIEVVLAVEFGVGVDRAVKRECGADYMFHGLLVRRGQGTRHSRADRSAPGVRLA